MRTKTQLKLKIINKKRFVTFITSILILSVILTVMFFAQTSVRGQAESNYIYVHIATGDTLWDIALRYNQNHKDIRNFINEIMLENNMETAMLTQGQILRVPVK
ncbi:MAG: hypothetical protein PWR27_1385 [Petroclostridium sp.]|jgi:LysM repeat protein|uniref:cell division suppressor protein YneA n=1 Tax=Petroclostridium xylanilyticum TaxID=1792311 RepID=UPI000B984163|nr:LysM peptidoglycan-binding domain-containing protein [Petroclostridium xylanilyticum]MDK2810676.1 hypothetical protein [Petroclostridium sp.]